MLLLEEQRHAIMKVLPEDVSVCVVLHGDDGGEWTLRRVESRLDVVAGKDREVDCVLECSVKDFDGLLRGTVDGREGFLSGRLKIRGDVGLALGLERAIRSTPVPAPRRGGRV